MSQALHIPTNKRLKPADVVTRAAVTQLLRRQTGQHEIEDPFAVVDRVYANCPATTAYLKAATSPASTSTVGWAAELVGTATAANFLGGPPNESAYSQLAAQAMSITLPPGAGVIKIPSRAHPQTLVGAWTAENGPKPVSAVPLASVNLAPNKLACISVFSEELIEYSTPEIETVVRDVLQHDISAVLDASLVDAVAVSAVRPAGLFNGASSITASVLTPSSEAMHADLRALAAAVMVGAPGAKPVYIAHTIQAGRMAADGYPVIATGYLLVGSVGCVDARSIAMLTGSVTFAMSRDAAVHMEDTTPLALGSGTQGSGVLAVPMRSTFQTDTVALRTVLKAGWIKRRAGCAALATGVVW